MMTGRLALVQIETLDLSSYHCAGGTHAAPMAPHSPRPYA